MKREAYFNPGRILMLIKNDLFMNRHLFFFGMAAALGMLILFFLYDAKDGDLLFSYRQVFHVGLFVGGFLVIMALFSDVHNEKRGATWHTLPASLIEKLSGRIIVVTLIYTVAWYAVFLVAMGISEGMFRILSRQGYEIFNPFNMQGMKSTLIFWIFEALWIFGTVYFRKYAPVRLVVSLAGYFILMIVFAMWAQDLICGRFISKVGVTIHTAGVYATGGLEIPEFYDFWRSEYGKRIITRADFIGTIYGVTMMPVFWIMTYLRLKETEV